MAVDRSTGRSCWPAQPLIPGLAGLPTVFSFIGKRPALYASLAGLQSDHPLAVHGAVLSPEMESILFNIWSKLSAIPFLDLFHREDKLYINISCKIPFKIKSVKLFDLFLTKIMTRNYFKFWWLTWMMFQPVVTPPLVWLIGCSSNPWQLQPFLV